MEKEFKYVIEVWSLRKFLSFANDGKLCKLDHQRPLKLKKNHIKTFIEATLKNDMLLPYYLGDLQSSLEVSEGDDYEYFKVYIDNGRLYSTEDCQHRTATLQQVKESDFVGEFEGRMEEFLDKEISVYIMKNATRDDLIRKFGRTNSGRPIKTDEAVWGVNNDFNKMLKAKFVDDEKYIRLYPVKKKSDNVERTLYGNIAKILKVCGHYDGIIQTPSVAAESIMEFVKQNVEFNRFDDILNIFDFWYDMIKDNEKKIVFATQSNLFFILHIFKSKGWIWNVEEINNILLTLTDTRSLADTRYDYILKYVTREEYRNAITLN
jgi:hypothetical protein